MIRYHLEASAKGFCNSILCIGYAYSPSAMTCFIYGAQKNPGGWIEYMQKEKINNIPISGSNGILNVECYRKIDNFNPVTRITGKFNASDEISDPENIALEVVHHFTWLVSRKDDLHFHKLHKEFYVDINSITLAVSKTVCEHLQTIESKLPLIPNGLRHKGMKNTSSLTFDTCINVFERGNYVECDINTNVLNCASVTKKIPEIKSLIGQALHILESQIYFYVNTSHFACQTQMLIVQLGSEARANSTRHELSLLQIYNNVLTNSEKAVQQCGCSSAATATETKANFATFMEGLVLFSLGVLSVIYTACRKCSWKRKNEKLTSFDE